MLQDLHNRVWRELAWDQIHPRTGIYRPDNYPGCIEWTQLDEKFLRLPESPVKENRATRSQKWKSWLGGTYEFPYPSSEDCCAKVTLNLNWLEPHKSMRWTVETSTADAAYPGTHRGSLVHREDDPRKMELEWETPVFSPYVRLQKRDASQAKQAGPITAISSCRVSDYSSRISIMRDKKEVEVMVLQHVLKAICNILVHGPRSKGIPQEYKSPVELDSKYSSNKGDMEDLISAFFGEEARLRLAGSFFSRAYQVVDRAKDERQVTSADRQLTIESVICLFKHFSILEEPPWVEEDDWVENLAKDLEGVETYAAWQKMERKWATLASYSCGMELHRGPWAGPDWEQRVM